jgi:UDP-N-acetyl-D-mannosaminuronate dehydrogenase
MELGVREFGIEISGFDPLLRRGKIEAFGIDAAEDITGMGVDCVIMAVAHDAFKDISLSALNGVMNSDPVLVDIGGMFCGGMLSRWDFVTGGYDLYGKEYKEN